MRWYLYDDDKRVAAWVADRIKRRVGREVDFGLCKAIGLCDDENPIAGIVFHSYMPQHGNIEISMAADTARWATPDVLRVFLSYPFIQLGCRRVTTQTPASNKRAIKFNLGIGFKQEGLIREGYGTEDLIICGMLRHEAQQWLQEGEQNGEVNAVATSSTRSVSNGEGARSG